MQNRKTPKANLENKRGIFMLSGLLFAILIMVVAINWKSYEKSVMDLGKVDFELEDDLAIVTEREQKPPPPPPPPPDIIEVVEDEVELEEELEMEETETDEEEIIEIIEEEEETDEVFSFAVVEDKPIFPGCEGMSNKVEQTNCLNQKIAEHIRANFRYPPMAKDMGVQGRVYVQFTINKQGKISDATVVRSADKNLDKEALRIVNLLPKMTPAKQRGKPVSVAYTVPIAFKLSQ